ncbi:hypothetical protein ASPWEDRAFT_35547 [Aspergillus wentii DTO 134E9]|uniref:FAD-binding domain-containing protein n=1 Tax=Aspergillus wentii DTO 134E9 TaxID=1073089 RepID=A0A1L9S464_ASPWE|nr:uncharacterized protein ASPWEDRAFT_35547 [Aspergillus wentii DTO 134E9]OJJ41923.1 hypothetical protein ASPWEDRAFT_35547 [Aspergillus wentii DTO 134E9]
MDVLYKAIEPRHIPIYFSKKLVHIEEHSSSITVTFSDGTTDTADLLLGCDGIHSAVRTTYVDPDTHPEYSGNAGMFCVLPTSSLSTDNQFLLKGMHSTLTTDGMFACLPCKPDESELFWFFNRHVALPDAAAIDSRDGWVEKRQHELSNSKSTILSLISDAKGPWGSFLRDIITATPSLNFYPVYLLPLGRTWRKGSRCVLLGDAAHAMPPHASQGVSMALEDVFALSRALTLDVDLGECWDRYDRVRRPRVESIYQWTMANASHVGKTGSWGLWMKEMVVKWGLVFSNWFGMSTDERLSYDVDKAVL